MQRPGSRGGPPPLGAAPTQPLLFARPEIGGKPSSQKSSTSMSSKPDANTQALNHHQRAVRLLHSNKDLHGALAALNQAIEAAPRAPALRMDRGLLYRKLGRWSDAT